jgi:hypothetical protein
MSIFGESEKTISIFVLEDPLTMHPNNYDQGELALEAEIVKDYIPIKSVADMVSRVVHQVNRTGGMIRRLVISGHGGRWGFYIGHEMVTLNSDKLLYLALLRPFFTPDAVVTIKVCKVGLDQQLLHKLSALMGVRVVAYTGYTYVFKWGPFSGFYSEGDTIMCFNNQCEKTLSPALDSAAYSYIAVPPWW